MKDLIGVENPRTLLTAKWYRAFTKLEAWDSQPWYDRVIPWLQSHPTKLELFQKLDHKTRELVFRILAAGLWQKNEPIEFCQLVAVRTEEGTGFRSPEPESVVFVALDP